MKLFFPSRITARQFSAQRVSKGFHSTVGDNVADNDKALRYGPVMGLGKATANAVSKARYYVSLK